MQHRNSAVCERFGADPQYAEVTPPVPVHGTVTSRGAIRSHITGCTSGGLLSPRPGAAFQLAAVGVKRPAWLRTTLREYNVFRALTVHQFASH